jgi:hypothetical protein
MTDHTLPTFWVACAPSTIADDIKRQLALLQRLIDHYTIVTSQSSIIMDDITWNQLLLSLLNACTYAITASQGNSPMLTPVISVSNELLVPK